MIVIKPIWWYRQEAFRFCRKQAILHEKWQEKKFSTEVVLARFLYQNIK